MAISVQNLAKTYRDSWGRRVTALRDVTLEIRPGEIFGLLGPNGAGKSTTFKILLGLQRPSAGSGTILGRPLGDLEARARIGFLPENPYFYDYLTPREFLETCASLSGMPRRGRRDRIEEVIGQVGLEAAAGRRLRKFSKGMLQRVGMAQAILHRPELVILDEPMSGLDPVGRRQFRDLVLGLKAEGRTVLFASHVLPDVEALCDRVGMLVAGVVRRTGPVGDLLRADESAEIEAAHLPDSLLASWTAAGIARRVGDRVLIRSAGPAETRERVEQVFHSGGRLLAVRPVRASLEEAFLQEMDGAQAAPVSAERRGAA